MDCCDDATGVGVATCSSLSESSSSPMVKAVLSSGTLLNDGARAAAMGLRLASIELVLLRLSSSSASFFSIFSRSSSASPLSSVNSRRAWIRFFERRMASTTCGLSRTVRE